MIFRNGLFFMGNQGLYLESLTLVSNRENDVPSIFPVWVKLPHIPLHCWDEYTLRNVGNALGKYIDRATIKDSMYACDRICIEVDLEKGIPEAIQLSVDNWSHIQLVAYDHISFKCRHCHNYGHFARNLLKKVKLQISKKMKENSRLK